MKSDLSSVLSFLVFLLLFSLILGCSEETPSEDDSLLYQGSWIRAWSIYGQDGNPLESDRVIVYTNYASDQTKEFVATSAEEAIDYLLGVWDVNWDEFDFLPSYSSPKIHIFADHDQGEQGGLAYRDGIIIRAPGSPRYNQFGWTMEQWQHTLRHELSHVMEFLMIGEPAYQQGNTVWLREGSANFIAGKHDVQTLEELESWIEKMKDVPGGGNPIGITVWNDFPQSIRNANRTIEYYRYFELATRYLADPDGHGGSIEDIKNLYEELGRGRSVYGSFRDIFGMTIDKYEEGFFDLMRDYLGS